MRLPRERQFDPANPPWLHCISRCVRRAFLCGDDFEHRRAWIERRLKLLSQCCAVEVGAYAIMANHLHVVLRPRPEQTTTWTPQRIATAWLAMRENQAPEQVTADPQAGKRVAILSEDPDFIARWRDRLGSLSWFMKAVKEPLSRMANREDGCSGTFWEGRFRSIPLLDTAAVVTCMAYVDLNPIRAQIAATPEDSLHTSVRTRIRARQGGADASWLAPVEQMTAHHEGDAGMAVDDYLRLVDACGRCQRADKAGAIPQDLADILARLDGQLQPSQWLRTVLLPHGLRGSALGALPRLAEEAKRRGLNWLQARCGLFPRRPAAPAPTAGGG
jgi:REP element-mobilizing transposase RayT